MADCPGVIEGACRHPVADRLDIAAARWSPACAEAALKLRALTSNADIETYWASTWVENTSAPTDPATGSQHDR